MYQVFAVGLAGEERLNLTGSEGECEGFVRAQRQFLPAGWRLVVRRVTCN